MNINAALPKTSAELALVDGFNDHAGRLPGNDGVAQRRVRAVEVLKRGLPSRRVEAWHYTDLRRHLTSVPSFQAARTARPRDAVLAGSTVLPILNGQAGQAYAGPDMIVSRLAGRLAEGHLTSELEVQGQDDTIGAINAAYVSDGYDIEIGEGAVLKAPVELQNIHAGGQAHSRSRIRVGAGAKATVVERHSGDGEALSSAVSHVTIAEGADIVWLVIQDQPQATTHLGQFNASIGANARLTLFVMNCGGRLVRQEIRVRTDGEGSQFTLRGINLLGGDNHTDVTMLLDHAVAHATSTEVIRSVVTGKAQGVFQGMIKVAREAQKTDAKMACNTLLLSDEAGFSSKPELEIFADDVQCGHGATVTEINPEHLFYLMARGIDERSARGLLVEAFLAELIEELEDETLVEALEERLHAWFESHG